jgi:hypothetical protein
MDLRAKVRGTLSLQHHHPDMAVVVTAVVALASANASLLSGNNCHNNNHKAAMRAVISLALQVADEQQRQWGGWLTSAARGCDDNNDNDDYSVPIAGLAVYPELWHANLYSGGGDGLAPSLQLRPGQYTSLFGNLLVAGVYHGGGFGGDRLQDGHQAFATAMNAMLQGFLCYATINIKERR